MKDEKKPQDDLFKEAKKPMEPEVMEEEPAAPVPKVWTVPDGVALRVVEKGTLAVVPQLTAQGLATTDAGVEMFERFTQNLERVRWAAIRATSPRDWVLSRVEGDGEQVTLAMFCATGVPAIFQIFGLEAVGDDPMFGPVNSAGVWTPEVEQGQEKGEYGISGWAKARSTFTGQVVEVIGSRWNTEQFAGRTTDDKGRIAPRGDLALSTDLAGALHSLLKKKLAVAVAGLAGVTGEELGEVWKGTGKSTKACRKGHGFGTSSDRKARGVADEDVAVERVLLRDELLSLTGGDASAAQDLLKEVSAWEGKDGKKGSFSSVDRLAKSFQFENAWKALRSHSTFGDRVSSPAEIEKKRAAAVAS